MLMVFKEGVAMPVFASGLKSTRQRSCLFVRAGRGPAGARAWPVYKSPLYAIEFCLGIKILKYFVGWGYIFNFVGVMLF